jgi:hypothetical protein
VAISVAWQTTATFTTTKALYTTATATATTFAYARDLVLCNAGTATVFVAAGPAVTSAVTTSSFGIPAGGSIILTQCQVPVSTIIFGVQSVATTTSFLSIGFATNVSYI